MSDLSVQLLHGRVRFQLGKSIPSADAAALIKFGVEKVSGVRKVHFAGDDIEVVLAVEGAAIGLIVDALAEAGFPSAVAADVASLGATLGAETGEQNTILAPEGDEEGAAIA